MTRQRNATLRDILFLLICLAAILGYLLRVGKVYSAQVAARSTTIENLQRSIRLSPENAEYPHKLGLVYFDSDQDYKRAATNLEKAVALNPNSGRYWLDLAIVYQVQGNSDKEDEALKSALSSEPLNPEVAEEAGQHFLLQGNLESAFPLLRQSLAQNPTSARETLRACWRQTGNADLIVSEVVPKNTALQLEFLAMLTEEKQTAAARQVWQLFVNSHQQFAPQASFFYLDYLIKQHEIADLTTAWNYIAMLSPDLHPYLPANENLVVNAGFEQPVLNAGLDWRHDVADHISTSIDNNTAHSGGHSLSVSYDGSPAYDAGWMQYVPVQANTDYEFSAWIKSENVISSSGPRIAITDAYSGATLFSSDDVLDTHPWTELKGTLHVPVNVELVAIKIVRAPADTRIRGTFWLDDLRLEKK